MKKVDEYIDNVHHLLPAPRVVLQLMQILNKPDADTGDIVKLISLDPSLTASVLRISNSAYFGGSTAINSLHEAVTRLGSKQVYRLVVAISGALTLSPPKEHGGIEAEELLNHSITTALAAQLIAQDRGDDDSMIFTAALLHDLGKIVLSAASKNFYVWVQDAESDQAALLETERKILGADHASVGGRVLERWKFPAEMVAAVSFHHQPTGAQSHQRSASYVYVGNMIAYMLGHGYGHKPSVANGNSDAMRILSLSQEDLQGYIVGTSGQLKAIKSLFGMN
jgi:putative nucleotidyltransferase with HDIG domain